MGLFGRKKSKSKLTKSTYSPPEDPPTVPPVTSEVASPDDEDSLVKVASVGRTEDPADESPEIVENESMISKASSYISGLFTPTEEVENVYSEHDDGTVKKSKKDEIMERITTAWAAFLLFWFSLPKVTQVALLAGAAAGGVAVIAVAAAGGHTPAFRAHINVAFVGNSYFYVNDLPRFVEQIAGGHVTQNSVIHNAASILQIIMTGNGMWHKWATKQAMINGVKYETSWNTTEYLYDMGACSVPQLLTGHDQMVTYKNNLGSFIDDGQNPCFQQDAYLQYQESFNLKHSWDFVVITDQSKTMAFEDTRQEALAAFNYTYGPILKKHHISPVIVQPHAYSSSGANSSGLDDLATFTALIMEGAQVYRKFINRRSGWFTKAHVAPVGNAFLAVYEESPYDIWPKLFLDDGIHPSAYGTFLYGCVIYATMTGYMPHYRRVVVDDMELSDIFSTARRVQSSSSQAGFPTKEEAAILYKIAKKVAVKGYKPKALRGLKIEEDAASYLRTTSNNNVYDGEYNGGQQYANGNSFYSQMYQNQANNNGYYNNNGYNNNNNNNNGANNGDYNYGNNNDYYEDNDDGNNNDYQQNYNYNNNEDNDDGNNNDYQQNYNYNNNANGNNNGNNNGNYNDGYADGNYNNANGNDNGYADGNYNNANGNDNGYADGNYNNANGNDNGYADGNYNNANGNYNGNGNGDNDGNNNYNGNGYNNGNTYSEAAEQYYQQYGKNKESYNNANQQQQYGGGNQNNQFYYQDLANDDGN